MEWIILVLQLISIYLLLKLRGQGRRLRRNIMTFKADVLKAIAEETTAVDSLIAFIQNNEVLSQADKDEIIGQIQAERDKVNTALQAGVTPPPTPTP